MKKKANKKGFTIMEMLIVVAIIAVLVAIAIPTFNGALTKSKEAADVANIRAAYAEVIVSYMTNDSAAPTYALIKDKAGKLNFPTKFTEDATNKQVVYQATKLENSKAADAADETAKHKFTWSVNVAELG